MKKEKTNKNGGKTPKETKHADDLKTLDAESVKQDLNNCKDCKD